MELHRSLAHASLRDAPHCCDCGCCRSPVRPRTPSALEHPLDPSSSYSTPRRSPGSPPRRDYSPRTLLYRADQSTTPSPSRVRSASPSRREPPPSATFPQHTDTHPTHPTPPHPATRGRRIFCIASTLPSWC
jgi:hypothetical protein